MPPNKCWSLLSTAHGVEKLICGRRIITFFQELQMGGGRSHVFSNFKPVHLTDNKVNTSLSRRMDFHQLKHSCGTVTI